MVFNLEPAIYFEGLVLDGKARETKMAHFREQNSAFGAPEFELRRPYAREEGVA